MKKPDIVVQKTDYRMVKADHSQPVRWLTEKEWKKMTGQLARVFSQAGIKSTRDIRN